MQSTKTMSTREKVKCPICNELFDAAAVNQHANECLCFQEKMLKKQTSEDDITHFPKKRIKLRDVKDTENPDSDISAARAANKPMMPLVEHTRMSNRIFDHSNTSSSHEVPDQSQSLTLTHMTRKKLQPSWAFLQQHHEKHALQSGSCSAVDSANTTSKKTKHDVIKVNKVSGSGTKQAIITTQFLNKSQCKNVEREVDEHGCVEVEQPVEGGANYYRSTKPVDSKGINTYSSTKELFLTPSSKINSKSYFEPLAEQMRPTELAKYVGQNKSVGRNTMLRSLLESHEIPSMILWGPPGCGKV